MASKYWIKLYHEILDDPKMGRLDDRLFRRTIELFLLAGENQSDGTLPSVEDIAWRLRVPVSEIETNLQTLQEFGIVSPIFGEWVVTKFSKRQAASPSAERTQRFRDGKRKEQYYGNEDVTNRDAEEETEEETEKNRTDAESEAEPAAAANQNAFSVYQSEIGMITSHISERLKADIDDYSEPWVIDAILIASGANARNMKYIEAILSRWKTTGKDDGKQKREYQGKSVTPMSGNEAILEEIRNGKF